MTQPETPAADTGGKIPIKTYVTQDQGADTFGFQCPLTGQCGEPGGPGYSTTGWPSAEIAEARGLQHLIEHRDGTLMQDIHDFYASHGLTVADDGSVRIGDLV